MEQKQNTDMWMVVICTIRGTEISRTQDGGAAHLEENQKGLSYPGLLRSGEPEGQSVFIALSMLWASSSYSL